MIIIEVESTAMATNEGTNEETGRKWKIVKQQCVYNGHYVDGFPARLPREGTVQLDDKNPVPYAPGKYVIAPEAFYFAGQYANFTLGRIKLQPLAAFLAELEKQLGVTFTRNQPKAA